MKFAINSFIILFISILAVNCSRENPTDTSSVNVNFVFDDTGSQSKQDQIDGGRVFISNQSGFYRQVDLEIDVPFARGSTVLEYGEYNFRIELLIGENIRFVDEQNEMAIGKTSNTVTFIKHEIISADPPSLDFGSVEEAQTKDMQFVLNGKYLAGNISVTAPAGYQVSKSPDSGFASSINFTPASGSVDAPVYVRFSPTAEQGYSGNIALTSTGATTVNVAVSGTGIVTPNPVIGVSTAGLSFGDVEVGNWSVTQTFDLTAQHLLANLTVTCPEGFEISKQQASAWTNQELTFTPSSGSVNAAVYIRGRATSEGELTGIIECLSENAEKKTVNLFLNGVITTPYITADPGFLDFGDVELGSESDIQSFTLTAGNLNAANGDLMVSVSSANCFISKTVNAADFISGSLFFQPADGQVNAIVYVKIVPGAVGDNNSDITCSHLDGAEKTVQVNSTGIPQNTMVFVEGGTFWMGNDDDSMIDTSPEHQVTLSNYYIGRYEITQSEWAQYMPPAHEQNEWSTSYEYGSGADYPVYYVTWYSALVYCNKRSIAEGLTPCYSIKASINPDNWGAIPTGHDDHWNSALCNWDATGYRLPTEAEWEYAARGGKNSLGYTYSGSNTLSDVGWNMNNSEGTSKPVGLKAPNEIGLYDMSGNAAEWVWDRYDTNYYQECHNQGTVTNPRGPSDGSPVFRGGYFEGMLEYCETTRREMGMNYQSERSFGLRLVKKAQ